MQLAFYKGTRPGLQGWFNRFVRLWCRGRYSHVELVFSDGMSGSASGVDHGVRFKRITFDPARWDLVTIEADEEAARRWIADRVGWGYDFLGLLGFILRPIKGSRGKAFCSECAAGALGYLDPWRFDVCDLAAIHGIQP